MSETATDNATPAESDRRLIRPADDRVVAGVCSGLARYFGLDPLVYRVAFAALVLLGGSGLLLYAAAWLVIPDERRGDSLAGQAIGDRRNRPWLVVGVGLAVFGILLGLAESRLWPDPGSLWLAALAAGLAVVMWQVRDRPAASAARPAEASADALRPVDSLAATEITRSSAGATAAGEAARQAATSPRPRRFPVFLPTVGVLLAGAGVLGILEAADVVDVDWALAIAGAVVVVGLAVAVGAFFGATGALAVTVDLPLHGPIGDRAYSPVTVTDLQPAYELAIGTLQLDLSKLELPAGTTHVSATVGIGELTVLVPAGANAEINTDVQAGESTVFGQSEDGWGVSQRITAGDPAGTGPTLVLDAEVGLGDLEVRRG
jgi:phage shock protein PspC (stress-responsive transcriptional regulator)